MPDSSAGTLVDLETFLIKDSTSEEAGAGDDSKSLGAYEDAEEWLEE